MTDTAKLDFEKWEPNTDAWIGNLWAAVHLNPDDCPIGRNGCEKGNPTNGWDLCPWFMGTKSSASNIGDSIKICCGKKIADRGVSS